MTILQQNLWPFSRQQPVDLLSKVRELYPSLNQRIAIKDLLGLAHIPYWLQPPMRVDSSFTAYPFTVQDLWPFGGRHSRDLVNKVRELYPSMSRGERRQAADVHRELGWDPLVLRPKEALALMNGTAVMTGLRSEERL